MTISVNFTLVQTELKPLHDQQVLVRNLFMSVDPYRRWKSLTALISISTMWARWS